MKPYPVHAGAPVLSITKVGVWIIIAFDRSTTMPKPFISVCGIASDEIGPSFWSPWAPEDRSDIELHALAIKVRSDVVPEDFAVVI